MIFTSIILKISYISNIHHIFPSYVHRFSLYFHHIFPAFGHVSYDLGPTQKMGRIWHLAGMVNWATRHWVWNGQADLSVTNFWSHQVAFWLVVWTYPSEKYDFVSWDHYSQLNGKNKNVPNHQPALIKKKQVIACSRSRTANLLTFFGWPWNQCSPKKVPLMSSNHI